MFYDDARSDDWIWDFDKANPEIELTAAMQRAISAINPCKVRKMHLTERVNVAKTRTEIARRAARLASVRG